MTTDQFFRLLPKVTMAVIACVLLGAATPAAQSRAELALKAAMDKEVIDGDLRAAIEEYKKIVATAGSNRALAAQALVRMAECYQKLGDVESKRIYERLVSEFGDQTEAVTIARARLGGNAEAVREGAVTLRKVWDGDISGTVSSDGRVISYNDWAAGHIGVRNLVDGTQRAITPSDWNVFQSVIAKDASQVAYTWVNNQAKRVEIRITSTQPGSASRQLFANDDVDWIGLMDWSPDGKSLAVVLQRADRTSQIALVGVPDGSLSVLTSIDWRGPTRIFFSPDSRHIGFDLPANDTTDQRDVFVLAVDGSRQVPVMAHPSQDVMMGWSPDGKYLLFATDRREGAMGLWAVPMLDGQPSGTAQMLKASIGSAWSLGVSRSGSLYIGTSAGDRDVAIVGIDISQGRVTSQPIRPIQTFIGSNTQPHFSPDGKSLAYVSARGFNPSSNNGRSIVIQSLDTGATRELRLKLTYFNQFNWSPDGRSLVTAGSDFKGREGIFRIDAETGEVAAVTLGEPGRELSYPEWSPDGRRLFYRRQDLKGLVSTAGVVERDVATGREREVIGGAYGLGPINVSPDGRWIVLQRGPRQGGAIVLIPINGGEPREMLRANPQERFANHQGMPWTPDGRGFLVRKRLPKGSELWFVPVEGVPRKLEVDATRWANGPVGAFSLHPDGRRLAVLEESRGPATQVWVLENFLAASSRKK